jgi:hypothetical protein
MQYCLSKVSEFHTFQYLAGTSYVQKRKGWNLEKIKTTTLEVMPRTKNDIDDNPNDGWIWGSSRGGGGAPLRTKDGTLVTNLKLVINGAVEPDHSPYSSPTRSQFGSGSKNTGRRGYDDDDEVGGRAGRNGGRRDSYDPYDDKDRDFRDERDDHDDRRVRRGSRGNARKIAFQDEEEPYEDRSSNRAARGGLRERNVGRGGSDLPNRDRNIRSPITARDRDDDRHTHVPGLGSPPKRAFMGALRELVSSEAPEERDAKHSKEVAYQNMLRLQIEEKKYIKVSVFS